jgi:hypothetical protein
VAEGVTTRKEKLVSESGLSRVMLWMRSRSALPASLSSASPG